MAILASIIGSLYEKQVIELILLKGKYNILLVQTNCLLIIFRRLFHTYIIGNSLEFFNCLKLQYTIRILQTYRMRKSTMINDTKLSNLALNMDENKPFSAFFPCVKFYISNNLKGKIKLDTSFFRKYF